MHTQSKRFVFKELEVVEMQSKKTFLQGVTIGVSL